MYLSNINRIHFFTDTDGDKISISKASDFALFLEQNINKIYAEASEASAWASQNSSFSNTIPTAPNPTNPDARSSNVDEIRRIFHEGYLCDVCDKQIYGFRYKCLDCEEFDICMDCEPRQIHKEHFLLRISNPIDGANNFHLQVLPSE